MKPTLSSAVIEKKCRVSTLLIVAGLHVKPDGTKLVTSEAISKEIIAYVPARIIIYGSI